MATVLPLLVQSHSDYDSLVCNSTYGHLRVHSERMWCVKWTADDQLLEWGREGGRNTGFSCVWARVNRDPVPTIFRILLHFVYVTATFGEMGQGRSVVIGLCCRYYFDDGAKQGYSRIFSYGTFRF